MKLNKKGITLIEIIISIVLISIVLVFLFTLLISVNDINEESETDTSYLTTKALMLKTIEEDLMYDNIESLNLGECADIKNDITSSADTSENHPYICQKLTLTIERIGITGDSEEVNEDAYIAIYYYDADPINDYVITYKHGSTVTTRKLTKFNGKQLKDIVLSKVSVDTKTFYKIDVPIIGPDGKDYSLLISYKTP